MPFDAVMTRLKLPAERELSAVEVPLAFLIPVPRRFQVLVVRFLRRGDIFEFDRFTVGRVLSESE